MAFSTVVAFIGSGLFRVSNRGMIASALLCAISQHNSLTVAGARFAHDPILEGWVRAALAPARATLQNPRQAKWLRYQGTWFAGVNALPNDAQGAIEASGPLQAQVIEFIETELGLRDFAWDAAQISICYPGYPKPMQGETHGADALPVANAMPRMSTAYCRRVPNDGAHLREYHGFILGIPLVEYDATPSPFVVWEGSQEIMRQILPHASLDYLQSNGGSRIITEVYHAAREQVFANCERVEIHARPGEAFLRIAWCCMAWRRGGKAPMHRRTPHDLLFPPRSFRPPRMAQ